MYRHIGLLILSLILSTPAFAGTATFIIKDTDGAPMPARIHLRHSNGDQPKVLKEQAYPFHDAHIVCDGEATVTLPADTYTFSIERSPEFTRTSGTCLLYTSDAADE